MFERYERQIHLIGKIGQEKLSKSKVLVVGAGGLGSSAIAYLAAAGVGKIGIVDRDKVEESNLQRQIIHAGKLGKNKAESAAEFVKILNPEVEVEIYPHEFDNEKAENIVRKYDVVLGCPDNFQTRFLINEVCVKLKKPFVHAAIFGWEGEAGVFLGRPCYRCYIPYGVESIGSAVIGTTAGIFGCVQALETIKIITGCGDTLYGKILRVDTKSWQFFELKIKSNPKCPVCSKEVR
ncbi:MAG: HesA/MoeB/ThiF family protein [Archaeoglobales archaeon]|nr:HesA/MoeB/ThiF family protein [Archaeoglobales archaeon]